MSKTQITKIVLIILVIIVTISCEKHNPAPIKIVDISADESSTYLLFENGDVMGSGLTNPTPPGPYGKFRFMTSNVKKIKATEGAFLALYNDNRLMGVGNSREYSFSESTNTTLTGGVSTPTLITRCTDFEADYFSLVVNSISNPSNLRFAGSIVNALEIPSANNRMLSNETGSFRKVFLGKSVSPFGLSYFVNHNLNGSNTIFYAIGSNTEGQLGIGDNNSKSLMDNAQVLEGNTPFSIKKILSEERSTLLLTNDGRLFACGANQYGQLGTGNNTPLNTFTFITDNVKDIAMGHHHAMLLKIDASVWICGRNNVGQLGTGQANDLHTFTKVFDNARLIACGAKNSFVVLNDNRLYASGINSYGQLGFKDDVNSSQILFREIPIETLL